MRRILLTVSVLLAVSGCGSGPFGPDEVAVDYAAGSASVAKGDVLRVRLGSYNSSIGDGWYLTGAPDGAVLRDLGKDYDSDCDDGATGCGGKLDWRFSAESPGTTTITLRYCYRSSAADCHPEPSRGPVAPVTLRVDVR